MSLVPDAASDLSTSAGPLQPTSYKISTITAIGSVNAGIDIGCLYKHCRILGLERGIGIVHAEYVDDKKLRVTRGPAIGAKKRRKTYRCAMTGPTDEKPPRRFDNQATFHVRINSDSPGYVINSKVFKNGNVQMTGVRTIDDGRACIEVLVTAIRYVHSKGEAVTNAVGDLRCERFKICMINSDFKMPFKINNPALQSYLMATDLISIYEPSIYPAVKAIFYWSKDNRRRDGICSCEKQCTGKGDGYFTGCKKITIAIFQTGATIITGATDKTMLDEVYEDITSKLMANRKMIEQKSMSAIMDNLAESLRHKVNMGNDILKYFGGKAPTPASTAERYMA